MSFPSPPCSSNRFPQVRPLFRRTGVLGPVGLLGLLWLVVLAGCAPSSSSSSGTTVSTRPRTPATLQILSPTPNEVTGPVVELRMQVTGATVVSPSEVTGIDPTQGHIHVSVDGKLVSMSYGETQKLTLAPGTHVVQAAFVATDHRPFANQVVASVLFQVKATAGTGATTTTATTVPGAGA